MNAPLKLPPPVLTISLIVASVAASIAALDRNPAGPLSALLINTPGSPMFADILAGQVWRLITPIFIHFGVLHVLFNMMMLWDLGRLIELLRGRWFLAAFVGVTGVGSNIAQYAIAQSPGFGGMSGVVYGLLGYLWLQGRVNPALGIKLHQSTVIMMIAWYALCWTGLLGPIANWAHTAGLAIGVAWGMIDRRPPRALPA